MGALSPVGFSFAQESVGIEDQVEVTAAANQTETTAEETMTIQTETTTTEESEATTTNLGEQVSSFVQDAAALFKMQREETVAAIKECRKNITNSSPDNRAQIRQECKAKLQEIKDSYKESRMAFKELFKEKRTEMIMIMKDAKAKLRETGTQMQEDMTAMKEKMQEERKAMVEKMKEQRDAIKEKLEQEREAMKEKMQEEKGTMKEKMKEEKDLMKQKMEEAREAIKKKKESSGYPGATAPNSLGLGTAESFVILSGGVITNGVPNQLVTGNTGHVSTLTAPFTYITGADFVGAGPLGTITTLGTPLGDQHAVFTNIGTVGTASGESVSTSGLACTFTFAAGAIDLATNTEPPILGTFPPGVYCIDGAASIGTAGITLTGVGDHVFKMSGALTSAASSTVTLTAGAIPERVFWVSSGPAAGASLGANTLFQGTLMTGAAAITLGADTNLDKGRLLSESAITISGGAHTITVSMG